MMKIVALDPGKTTGYSVGYLKDDDPIFKFESMQGRYDHGGLYHLLEGILPDWIVCESFEFRNKVRAGTELISAELIGVVHLYTHFFKNGLTFQNASTHGAGGNNGAFQNSILKQKGIYKSGKPHAMDSLRILLYWYEFGQGFQFNKRQGYQELMVHHL